MLQANVETLGNEAVSDLLVDNNTDGTGGDVPHASGTAVVEFVRHTCRQSSVTMTARTQANQRLRIPLWMAPLATISTGSPSLNDLM